jgi:hypothetical protein
VEFISFALNMVPFWTYGVLMFVAVYFSSYRDLLAVKFKVVLKWAIFVLAISIVRYFLIHCFSSPEEITALASSLTWLPTWSTFFVPWEDLSHAIPLAIMGRSFPDNYFFRTVRYFFLIVLMVDFGAGHLYQGVFAACMLAFYIPITLYFGKKHGFGTIMLCHVIYDLATVGLIKYLI